MNRCMVLLTALLTTSMAFGDEVFSGPQPGESLESFNARGVFDKEAGQTVDIVSKADGKPMLLVFVHEFSRPTLGLTRILMSYAEKRSKDGLVSAVVFLNDDTTEAENMLRRASHALPLQVPNLISVDGREGPGSYGLNRDVAMTILVAKDKKVAANFALVQPSIQADAERIVAEVVKVLGSGKAPSLAELTKDMEQMVARERDPGMQKFEELLRSLIRKTNDDKTVERFAAEIEKAAKSDPRLKARLSKAATNIVSSGKLADYGTPKAQEFIQRWSEESRKISPQPKATKDG